jgi:glycosyltransferase involved in cell wall biosynthesis
MTERTTVWYFLPALSYGGTERTLVDLANGLDADQYDVTVWTIFDENPLASNLDEEVTLRTLGASGTAPGDVSHYVARAETPVDYVRAPLRFLSAVRRTRPDILQTFLFFDNVIGRLAGCVSPDTTVISGVRSVESDPSMPRAILDRVTLPLADFVVSNSRSGARLAIDRGAPSDRVGIVWNGRDVGRYGTGDPSVPRADLDLHEDAPVVGTVGRLIERKGHHDLLDAWPTVREHHPSAQLVIVGDGPRRDVLADRAVASGCRDSVVFAGIRDDIPALLALFDVFVFPSYFEGLPGALIEAMAAGLPIVTTPVDGCAELIGNYEHGLHVSVGSPTELAWATVRLLDNPDFAAVLGENARRRAREDCTIERMVAEFESLYERIRNRRD